jgi:hypothetical protein
MASMRRRAASQSSPGKVGAHGDVERADEHTGEELGIGRVGHGLAGAVLRHQASTCASRAPTSGSASATLPCMISIRSVSSSRPMTSLDGSRQRHLESAETLKKAGSPSVGPEGKWAPGLGRCCGDHR